MSCVKYRNPYGKSLCPEENTPLPCTDSIDGSANRERDGENRGLKTE